MNEQMNPLSLAARRAALIAQCAEQRGALADELNALKVPVERVKGAGGFLFEHRKSVLAGAGVALGLLIARPKRTLALAAAGASAWKVVQQMLPMVRARFGGQLD